ncbi:acyl-CoA synthetase [Leptothrix discophora]|uniref:Acyl-CoA synthetase n=1 Tax=Leptothrix discophora TaxID=89 RepID=A0ABT9G8W3_LEPDI|nr:acyl-CoA synthetase [Leptothrix discophora]MDP4302915.1 acyl-CoA synthetase [Leptothrix discophora]
MAPESQPDWTRQPERGNRHALALMRWIAMALGRRIARGVLHPITLFFMLTGGAATRASRQYLAQVLGRPPRWSERYRHVHHFAATILDRVYLLQRRHDAFDIRVTNPGLLMTQVEAGRGAMLAGAHLGSFEVLRSLGEGEGQLRVAMLMFEDNARQINATLRAIAPDTPLHVIALGRMSAMLELRAWLDGNGVAGLLADRTLRAPGTTPMQRGGVHRVNFLGRPASFSDGPFRLAMMLRRPLLFMAGLYHGGRRYELRFIEIADFSQRPADGASSEVVLQRAVLRYVEILEGICHETPYNWFNFFDFWSDPDAPT